MSDSSYKERALAAEGLLEELLENLPAFIKDECPCEPFLRRIGKAQDILAARGGA